MTSAFDAQMEQLTREAQTFFDAWSELMLLPLAWIGAAGGAATRYRSDEFSIAPLPVDRTLVPGPLTIGIPRAGYLSEQIPAGALRVVPSVLPAGHNGIPSGGRGQTAGRRARRDLLG